MFRTLKEMMWEVITDVSEVFLNRRETLVEAVLKQKVELRLMNLEAVDLLMLEREGSHDCSRVEELLAALRRRQYVATALYALSHDRVVRSECAGSQLKSGRDCR